MSSKKEKLPPNQVPIKRLLKWGTDHPAITSKIPKISLDTWALVVGGEVKKPLRLDWNEIATLPKTKSISNFHCVEGWSVLDCEWEGIRFRTIVNLAEPLNSAKYVTFEGADGYTTSLTLEELSKDNVLLAYTLNGKPLEEGYGFPLRLVVPDKYAYKSILWLTQIKFTSKKELGYWESRGYSDTAHIWNDDRFAKQ